MPGHACSPTRPAPSSPVRELTEAETTAVGYGQRVDSRAGGAHRAGRRLRAGRPPGRDARRVRSTKPGRTSCSPRRVRRVSSVHRWTDPAQTPERLRPCVATFGNFDGVHLGHRAVLARLVAEASERGLPSVAVTFDPHPAAIFHPDDPRADRARHGCATTCSRPPASTACSSSTSPRSSPQQTAEEFVVRTFVETLGVQARSSSARTPGASAAATPVTSTTLRRARRGARLRRRRPRRPRQRRALVVLRGPPPPRRRRGRRGAAILGRPHRMTGTVVHGAHRGRELGYPTANLAADSLGLVPADGVYAGWLTRVGKPADDPERTLPAAISVGTNPTFDGTLRDRRGLRPRPHRPRPLRRGGHRRVRRAHPAHPALRLDRGAARGHGRGHREVPTGPGLDRPVLTAGPAAAGSGPGRAAARRCGPAATGAWSSRPSALSLIGALLVWSATRHQAGVGLPRAAPVQHGPRAWGSRQR